jgi:hypothetical protein
MIIEIAACLYLETQANHNRVHDSMLYSFWWKVIITMAKNLSDCSVPIARIE